MEKGHKKGFSPVCINKTLAAERNNSRQMNKIETWAQATQSAEETYPSPSK